MPRRTKKEKDEALLERHKVTDATKESKFYPMFDYKKTIEELLK